MKEPRREPLQLVSVRAHELADLLVVCADVNRGSDQDGVERRERELVRAIFDVDARRVVAAAVELLCDP
jgi:hypothetical protein